MSIESLKQKARKHEQNEDWKKALEQYNKALAELARDEQVDIGLYNRVGDLYVRVGDLDAAVEHYDKAVELYREAYLPNNAIAVCKKIIRNVPDRHRAYLVIGQIRAEQGFIPDARTNFLTYAERMQQAGDLDESFRALIEFCDVAPDDVGVRLTVADQMLSNGRKQEAIEQLMVAHRHYTELGNQAQATDIESRIFAIDPEADMSALVAGATQEAADPHAGGVPGFGEITFGEVDLSEGSEEEISFEVEPSGETDAAAAHAQVEEDIGPAELPMLEVDSWSSEPSEPSPEESVRDAADAMGSAVEEARGAGAGTELPLEPYPSDVGRADDQHEPVSATPEVAPPAAPSPSFEEGAGHGAPPAAAEPPAVAETPTIIEPPPVAEPPVVTEEPAAGTVDTSRPAGGAADSVADFPPAAPEAPLPPPEPVPPLPHEPAPTQATAMPAPATQAPETAEPSEPEPAEATPPAAESEGYVDLAAMILGGGEEKKTTRFTVAYEEPSGDEDADFAKMLSQFKDKVSENLDSSDVRAHYDLGTAYKEMGLLDEAISSFQAALRASSDHLPTYELMGQTFMEMGQPEAAVKSLERALQTPGTVEDELVAIYYYLGRAYEQLENRESAVEYYDRVFSLDINFADVTERLRQLR